MQLVTLRGISVKNEASLCKCDDTAMPLSFKEENMHLISPSFLMGLIQWPFNINGDTLTLANFEAGLYKRHAHQVNFVSHQ